MNPEIYIDTYKVDLYKDESISIKSSIADISDITKLKTDFSRTFTVPASKLNNKLFKRYYNANIDNTFDARKQVTGRIEIGGIPFRYGKWTLQKVQVKKGKPENYTINFTGNLIDLSREFGKDELKDLDFSSLEQEYNGDNVKTGLTNELFSGKIKYCLFANKQYYYNSSSNDVVNEPELVNIADNGVSDIRGVDFRDLKGSLNVMEVINAIEIKYPKIKFTRDFFNDERFKNLYILMAKNEEPVSETKVQVDFNRGNTTYTNLTTDETTLPYEGGLYYKKILKTYIHPKTGYENVEYKISSVVNGVDKHSTPYISGNKTSSLTLSYKEGLTHVVKTYVTSKEIFEFDVRLQQRYSAVLNYPPIDVSTYADDQIITPSATVSDTLPKVQIYDFIKAIFKAFKLVAIPNNNGEIYVETLNNFYSQGNIINVEKYIDVDSFDVERGDLLNEITFKFEDPNTILNEQFKKTNGLGYGDEYVKLEDEYGDILDGDSLEIELPFEQVVFERLNDTNTSEQTNIGYASLIDLDRKPSTPKILLHYIDNINIASTPIKFIGSNEELSSLTQINVPSNSLNLDEFDDESAPFSFLFSSEFSYYTNDLLDKNLYTEFHKKYIEGIFNPKRRNFYYKAVFPDWLLAKIQLNDILNFNNNYYRIDYFESDVTTGETQLKLFNAYDSGFIGKPQLEYFITQTKSIFYPYTYTSNDIDTGFGTSWFSYAKNDKLLTFTLLPNGTGVIRTAIIELTNEKGFISTVYITQQPKIVTFDNTNITFDNTNITFDNG